LIIGDYLAVVQGESPVAKRPLFTMGGEATINFNGDCIILYL